MSKWDYNIWYNQDGDMVAKTDSGLQLGPFTDEDYDEGRVAKELHLYGTEPRPAWIDEPDE